MKGVIRGTAARPVYLIDGVEVTREVFEAAFPPRAFAPGTPSICGTPRRPGNGRALCHFQPILSDALAVHPSQVQEATQDAIQKGVPTDFLPDGRPVLRTRAHRKQYMKAYGFFDRNAGYGDQAPRGEITPSVNPKDY